MRPIKFLYPALIIIFGLIAFAGCDHGGVKNDELTNQPPIVQFVNIPPGDSKFSTDTTLYWYGTDVDGFVVMYKYAIVEGAIVGSDPDVYLSSTPSSQIPWVELTVDLNDPQTQQKVNFSADITDPVRNYVESYAFLMGIDNEGASSQVIYRKYSKNNHFPETFVDYRPSLGRNTQSVYDPYVNTLIQGGILDGVTVYYSATDEDDYPINPPPFEFQWKFFGPYEDSTWQHIDSTYYESVFVDIYGDFYYCRDGDCDEYPDSIAIDTFFTDFSPDSIVIDSIIYDTTWVEVSEYGNESFGKWRVDFLIDDFRADGFGEIVDSSYDPLTQSSWVWDDIAYIDSCYKNFAVDTTVQMKFLFWVQARDDSKVPDPIPTTGWVSVIDPKFEREVILVDVTRYQKHLKRMNWPLYKAKPYGSTTNASEEPMVRNFYSGLLNSWRAGSFDGDESDVLPDLSEPCPLQLEKWGITQDYYTIAMTKTCTEPGTDHVVYGMTLRDVLKHKKIILIHDGLGGQIKMNTDMMLSVLTGIDAGMSCWTMARMPFTDDPEWVLDLDYYNGFMVDLAGDNNYSGYSSRFGVERLKYANWGGAILWDINLWYNNRVEDFSGAIVLPEFSSSYSDLAIDTSLLESRYIWASGSLDIGFYPYRCDLCSSNPDDIGKIISGALPEVGYLEKSPYAEAMYLFESKYGNRRPGLDSFCCREVGNWGTDQGSVVAVRFDAGAFRTSHFAFTLLAVEESQQTQETFNSMMDWLDEQPLIDIYTGKKSANTNINYRVNVDELKRQKKRMHELKAMDLLDSYSDSDD